MATGERGSRHAQLEPLLCELTGAEAALVVNNNAGAVLLTLSALAQGREAVVSRGELVEIGGGFRIPDVMRQSGVQLVEVGTTNKTRLEDYEAALGREDGPPGQGPPLELRDGGLLRGVPGGRSLAKLGAPRGVPLFDDLGSGCLIDTAALGLPERTVRRRGGARRRRRGVLLGRQALGRAAGRACWWAAAI